MAGLLRLTAFVALLWCGLAHAAFPPQSFEYGVADPAGVRYPSASAACAAAISRGSQHPWRRTLVGIVDPPGSATGARCRFTSEIWNGSEWQKLTAEDAYELYKFPIPFSCVLNSELVNGECVCMAGFEQTDGSEGPQCAPKPKTCDAFGTTVAGTSSNTVHQSAGYDGGLVCHDGCSAFPSTAGKLDGKWYAYGPFTNTGSKCTAKEESSGGGGEGETEEPEFEPIPGACTAGKCPGTVNGTDVCLPCDSSRTDKVTEESKETTNPDGTKSTETTKTESSTKCEGNTCTTTTTTTTGSGDGGGGTGGGGGGGSSKTEGEKKETKEDFCKTNPKSAMCAEKGESSFGGSCAGGFQAKSDDAVLNAMAQEQHKRNCELLAKEGAEQSEVNSEMQKDKTNVTTDNPNNSEVDVSSRINTSDALGGGSCELNRDLVIQGFTVTLPFNNLCGSLGMLGNLLVAVAMLLAGRIITRG